MGTPNGCSSSAPVKKESANNAPDANPVATTQTGSAMGAVTSQSQLQQQQYWAKGTGFGTGSTAQTWDLDGAMQRQRQQEEQATCLLHTLAAYVHPSCTPAALTPPGCTRSQILPVELLNIVLASHLVAAICSYLRNDSGAFRFLLHFRFWAVHNLFLKLCFFSDGYGAARAAVQSSFVASSLYRGLPEISASLITFVVREQQGQYVDKRKQSIHPCTFAKVEELCFQLHRTFGVSLFPFYNCKLL